MGLLGGYTEHQDIAFEKRTGFTDDELAEFADELVRLGVDVVVAEGTRAARAAKHASGTIPIVMLVDGDPVKAGLVESLGQPGGNVTGLTALNPELGGKRLEVLKEVVPGLTCAAVLWNPTNPDKSDEWDAIRRAARVLGLTLESVEATAEFDVRAIRHALAKIRCGGLLVLEDRLWQTAGFGIAAEARARRVPVVYPSRWYLQPFVAGLMSYGPSAFDLQQRIVEYVHRVLQGANPGAMPIERPARLELVINLRVAEAMGLTIPQSVLIRADEIIE